MEKTFSYIKELIDYIFLKEQEISHIKEELKNIKTQKEQILNDICILNAKIPKILMHEEERNEELRYSIIPYALTLIFIIIIVILFYSKIYTLKIIFLIIPILLSFGICDKLSLKTKNKYAKIREEKQDLVAKERANIQTLLDKQKELTVKEESLSSLLKELESEIKAKKEYLKRIEAFILTALAPTLDQLIEEEIARNNNVELQDILNRIREI